MHGRFVAGVSGFRQVDRAVEERLVVIGEGAADIEHVVGARLESKSLAESGGNGGAGQHRGGRILPTPEHGSEGGADVERCHFEQRGVVGPLHPGHLAPGQLEDLVKIAQEMAGRLLDPGLSSP